MLYKDDLIGYDGLYRFIDLFYSFDEFRERINDYMFINQIEDNEEMEKLFNILFKRYKGFFFRWKDISNIYNKIASRYEILLTEVKSLKYIIDNIENLTGEFSISTSYTRDNTEELEEDNKDYSTEKSKNVTYTGKEKIELLENKKKLSNSYNRFIDEFTTLLMKLRDENIYNSVYTKEG